MARDLIFVKPIGDAKIRKPDTKEYLRADGEELERSSFWIRRQMAGEVSISKVVPAAEAQEPAVEDDVPKKTATKKKTTKKEVTGDADIV